MGIETNVTWHGAKAHARGRTCTWLHTTQLEEHPMACLVQTSRLDALRKHALFRNVQQHIAHFGVETAAVVQLNEGICPDARIVRHVAMVCK